MQEPETKKQMGEMRGGCGGQMSANRNDTNHSRSVQTDPNATPNWFSENGHTCPTALNELTLAFAAQDAAHRR